MVTFIEKEIDYEEEKEKRIQEIIAKRKHDNELYR